MGSRNLDRVPMSAWRAKCETVGQMWRADWRYVRARCEACHAEFQIDLEKVIREKGPKTSLWNRRQACPREGCAGPVHFMVRIPGIHFYQQMDAPDPAAVPRRRTLKEWAEHNREPDDGDAS
jgi:hypothetical protein